MKNKASYVDGYLLVVPKKNNEAYQKIADEYAELWIKHGALSVRECRGDDLHPDMGEDCILIQFDKLMNTSPEETVWYSYIEYASKEDRDRINKAVEKEMTEVHKNDSDLMKNMPFDMKRMAFGGFEAIVSKDAQLKGSN